MRAMFKNYNSTGALVILEVSAVALTNCIHVRESGDVWQYPAVLQFWETGIDKDEDCISVVFDSADEAVDVMRLLVDTGSTDLTGYSRTTFMYPTFIDEDDFEKLQSRMFGKNAAKLSNVFE